LIAQDIQAGVEPPREAVKPARDPELRRRNRRLGLVLVGICLVMAACGFVYVRWVMMLPAGKH